MAVIRSVGCAKGELKPIELVALTDSEASAVRLLRRDGFRSFSQSFESVIDLTEGAVTGALHEARISPSAVEAVIICSESGHLDPSVENFREDILYWMATKGGLLNATPYANNLLGCANVSSALSIANSLIDNRQHSNVLVVLVDRVLPAGVRLARNGLTVFSDGASAALLSSRGSGFKIRSITLHFSAAMMAARKERNTLLGARAMSAALNKFKHKIDASGSPKVRDHSAIFADSFHSILLQNLSEIFGISEGSIVSPIKAEGHFFASDCLLALRAIRANRLFAGKKIGLFNIGPTAYGFISLEMLGGESGGRVSP